MNTCLIEYFGLGMLVDRNDCKNCPFKKRSECKKLLNTALKEANNNYLSYLQTMNRENRRRLTGKEKESIYNSFKRDTIKKLLKEEGIVLKKESHE